MEVILLLFCMYGEYTDYDDYKYVIFLKYLKKKYGKVNDEIINSELRRALKIGKKLEKLDELGELEE